jgi:hypothetical protein
LFNHIEQTKEKQTRQSIDKHCLLDEYIHIQKNKVSLRLSDYRPSGLYFGGLNKAGPLPLTVSFVLATV